MKYKDFKLKWMNKGVDIDLSYGFQCWDSFAQWCKENNIPIIDTTPIEEGGSGYVKDLWERRHSNGMLNVFNEVSKNNLNEGDVIVFKEVQDWTPVSHIALFDSDAGNGFCWFFGQNQGGIPGEKVVHATIL